MLSGKCLKRSLAHAVEALRVKRTYPKAAVAKLCYWIPELTAIHMDKLQTVSFNAELSLKLHRL